MQGFRFPRSARALVLGSVIYGFLVTHPAATAAGASTAAARPLDVAGGVAAQPRMRAKIFQRVSARSETRKGLRVHAGPSARSRQVGTLPPNATRIEITGETMYVEAEQIGWTPIRYGGLVGWTYGRYLRPCDVYLGNTLVFTTYLEGRGCAEIFEITYSPTSQHFLIIVHGFEAENLLYVMQADGRGLRQITEGGDFLSGNNYAWAADGRSVTYLRSTDYPVARPIPPLPPGKGVRYDLRTGEKTTRGFRVVNVRRGDGLNIRARPSAQSRIAGAIPANGTNVTYIGGVGVRAEGVDWWRVRYGSVTGYVNSAFLRCGVPASTSRWQEGFC